MLPTTDAFTKEVNSDGQRITELSDRIKHIEHVLMQYQYFFEYALEELLAHEGISDPALETLLKNITSSTEIVK